MTNITKHIVFIIFCTFPLWGFAQNPDIDKILESVLESQLNKIENGADVSMIIEDLEKLYENPININNTNSTELSRLYILNDIQINKLLDFVKQYGPVYSIYELNTIDGFSPDLLKLIQPFIYFETTIQDSTNITQSIKYARHQLLLRTLGTIQKADGYKTREDGTTPYEGNRFRYYSRYAFNSKNISGGFTAEKDPGEAFFNGSNNRGFDFYSGFASLKTNKIIKNVTIGDYTIRSGQGLVLWQGYSNGKSENTVTINKTGQGTRGYTSVDENNYFRGVSTTISVKNSNLTFFFSHKKVDGNIETDSSQTYFTSLQTSGYHRTESEIADEKSVKSTNIGGVFSQNFKNLRIGGTVIYQKFDMPFIRSDQLYNRFRFNGESNYTAGIDYLYCKGKYQLFGEAAMSKSKGKAFVNGTIIHLNDQFSISAHFRYFDKNYHSLWANTFAESDNINNETGVFLGLRFLPAQNIKISAYSDFYQSKWINYSTAAPARSWDIFAQTEFHISEKVNLYIRFKNEEKEQKIKSDKVYKNIPIQTQKARLHFQYQPNNIITLKTRIEHVYYKSDESENGLMIFQDFQYAPEKFPLKLSARFAWFHTESYYSRIYAYENDILYAFSIPAYYGEGFRTYLNCKFRISKKIEAWIKIANTHWTDRQIISSGYNEIDGSDKTEVKFQLRLKF
jgi:hypothetical protein